MSAHPLLKVENLKTHFTLPKSHPFAPTQTVFAVDGVSAALGAQPAVHMDLDKEAS